MSTASPLDKLVYLRRVTGFVKQGVFPCERVVKNATAFIGDLESGDAQGEGAIKLGSAKNAFTALSKNIVPSEQICAAGMQEINVYLHPMLRARREADASEKSQSSQRPRGH